MLGFWEVIQMRRSIREFTPEDVPDGMTSKQYVWNDFGRWAQHQIAEAAESYVIKSFPYESEPWGLFLVESLGSVDGKTILD